MSGRYRRMGIEFMDGTETAIGGTGYGVDNGILTVYTDSGYGARTNVAHFPIVNIKSFGWEER